MDLREEKQDKPECRNCKFFERKTDIWGICDRGWFRNKDVYTMQFCRRWRRK